MKITYRPFDHISRAIYSQGLITAVMLFVIAYMTMFSHTLFLQVLPTRMPEEQRDLSAWLMAIGWDLTLLVTMGNPQHIHRSIPWIGAVASGIIVLFFFEAFDFRQEPLLITQRWFSGILAAVVAFIYTRLFHAKHQHRDGLEQMPQRIAQLEAALDQERSRMHQNAAELTQARAELEQSKAELAQAKAKLAKHDAELVCPFCQLPQENSRSLNTHKGYCTSNPNGRGKKVLNGHAIQEQA